MYKYIVNDAVQVHKSWYVAFIRTKSKVKAFIYAPTLAQVLG